ncbi:hypothetical protein KJ785_01095 [Patescibacteria group bacterium]|nr:hypothetical protein [Patescibacteria group bacterium]
MNYKNINLISIIGTVFNLFIYYILDVKLIIYIFAWNLVFWAVLILLGKIAREFFKKEGVYIFYKRLEKETVIFMGCFVIFNGLLNFNLDFQNGYSLPFLYLVISILENFIEKYLYRNEKLRKIVNYFLFISFFILSPIVLVLIAILTVKYGWDIVNALKGIILIIAGYGIICLTIFERKKIKKYKI